MAKYEVLEVVSKRQIMVESPAITGEISHLFFIKIKESNKRPGLKTERTRQYVSISMRGTTRLSDIRWGFETTSSGFERTNRLTAGQC